MLPIPAAEESLRAALALPSSKPLRGGHEGGVSAVAFSPRWALAGHGQLGQDGAAVGLAGGHGRARGLAGPRARGHGGGVQPRRALAGHGQWDNTVRLWDWQVGMAEPVVERGHVGGV